MSDVIIIEPFLMMPTLPCLAPAILSAGLKKIDINCNIEYVALKVFYNQNFFKNKTFLSLADNISVQILELFFLKQRIEDLKFDQDWIYDNFGKIENENIDIIKTLEDFRIKIQKEVLNSVNSIIEKNPKIICFSMTFGDINFMNFIIEKIKIKLPNIKIVVGGSNFNEHNANSFIIDNKLVDYVICDEGIEITVSLINALLKNSLFLSDFIASRENKCKAKKKCYNLDDLPFPNFDDYMNNMIELKIENYKITLPIEMSRGCWWAEKKPCKMCGFFGDRRQYISKTPQCVVKEIIYLINKYNVKKFRFCDLVQPKLDYLLELTDLKKLGVELFIEFRPEISYDEINIWKQVGVNMVQIGLESFNDEILNKINKGTSLLHNIMTLRNLTTLKIETYWNYLYGFEFDKTEWYIEVVKIMKKLHHLYPPIDRRVWINKYSQDYFEKDKLDLINCYNHDNKQSTQEYFYKYQPSDDYNIDKAYLDLKNEINKWKEDFLLGEKNQLTYNSNGFYILKRHKNKVTTFELNKLDYQVLILCMIPKSVNQLSNLLTIDVKYIVSSINKLEMNDSIIKIKDKYITLTTLKNDLSRPKDLEKSLLSPSIFFKKL
ncbi:RiPP maturation radical SAM C-methyltransferase [Thomasclavelia spiroformis]|uniref:RiPP maturation radical SAM C-methyltransferase n=1 Tax=Thomasclavelia spiroformis TaxID=29348 RepID=UPI003990BCAC